jgi:hypothetical protein
VSHNPYTIPVSLASRALELVVAGERVVVVVEEEEEER